MSRVGYALLVFAGALLGLFLLVALLASVIGDVDLLVDKLGWLGVLAFLIWPALMTAGVVATSLRVPWRRAS